MTNARVAPTAASPEWRPFRPCGVEMKRIALALLLHALPCAAFATDACLDQAIQSMPALAGSGQIVVAALAPDGSRETHVLAGDAASAPRLDGHEGFRLASITKTYVAAAALRLHEDGRLDLQAPITRYLPKAWMQLLATDGYRPVEITVRHL